MGAAGSKRVLHMGGCPDSVAAEGAAVSEKVVLSAMREAVADSIGTCRLQ